MNKTPLVILESPYAGEVQRNTEYARACLLDSLKRGEAPIVSHLLYTQVLDDTKLDERNMGINAGLAWKTVADKQVFYVDYGMSSGMEYGLKYAEEHNIPTEIRRIY